MKSSKSKSSRQKIASVSDLARYLGLSDWTVSRAINGHPAVKATTRERVLQTMQDFRFQPNPLARGLRGKGTGLVGVCFGNMHSPVLVEKVAFLDRFLRENRLRSVLAVTGYDKDSEIRAIEDFHRLRVESIVLEQTKLTPAEATEFLRGMKRVFIDPEFPQAEPMVAVDRNTGMSLIMEHLISLGHRRFGLLGISTDTTWRWPGIAATLRGHRLNPDKVIQVFETPTPMECPYEMGALLAEGVLARTSPPTALVAHNDRVAIGAIHFLQKQGIKIPEEFSITGFDNLKASHFLRPSLTTVDHQAHLLMKRAVELLLDQIRKTPGAKARNLIIPLMVRGESTGPAPSASR